MRVLSFHADYRCRHSGACCTSDWPIPIEADRLIRIRAALAAGRLSPAAGDPQAAVNPLSNRTSDPPALLGRFEHRCVFLEADHPASRRCRIHSALGHDALPLACRQFPRVSLHDPRGVSVTLSHYCPTAAALLDADASMPLTIVTNAAAFPPEGEYVGLDARSALPPLVRRDLLMDWESWWDFEERAVELFSVDDDPSVALARLRTASADVQSWSPADGPLPDRIASAFTSARIGPPTTEAPDHARLIDAVFASIPQDIRPDRFPAGAKPSSVATRRFIAAHAFANWTMHVGPGLAAWQRSIESAAALLNAGAGVRQADLLLRHLAV